MQMADGARHRIEIVLREALGDVGVIEWRLLDRRQDVPGERSHLGVVADAAGVVLLSLGVVVDFGALRIRIGDAFVVLARNACGRLGSSGFARALPTIITSLSPCTRVAIAHSTSVGSKMLMSSSTTTTCLRSITDSAASSAFLASPGCFLIEITACQKAQPPSVTLMSFTCTPAVFSAVRIAE